MTTNEKTFGWFLILLTVLAVSICIPKTEAQWTQYARYHSGELQQQRYDEALRAQRQARIEKNRQNSVQYDAANNGPIKPQPLERNLALRRQQVRDWVMKTNDFLASTFYKALGDEPVASIEIDHGMRFRYFANGIYVLCHPDVPRSESMARYRTGVSVEHLRSAPCYQGHYVLFKDLDGKTQLKHGGGQELSSDNRQLFERLYGYPDYDAYRRYREKMRPEMERHKKKRELEQLRHFQKLAEASYRE